ncbi:hypothetical protein H5410_000550, partial [Solanum commersonii]
MKRSVVLVINLQVFDAMEQVCTWNAMISSSLCLCQALSIRLGGAIELGNEVAQLLLVSQQNHSGRYVQLSSIYVGPE